MQTAINNISEFRNQNLNKQETNDQHFSLKPLESKETDNKLSVNYQGINTEKLQTEPSGLRNEKTSSLAKLKKFPFTYVSRTFQ